MQHTLARAAQIADMPVATLRSWFQRELFPVAPDQQAPSFAGDARMLGVHTVLAVAIAAALTRLNVSPAVAATAGMGFAHTTSGYVERRSFPGALYRDAPARRRGGWSGDAAKEETPEEAHARANTETFLRIDAGGDSEIFPTGRATRVVDIMPLIVGDGAVILHLDPIVERVRKELVRS